MPGAIVGWVPEAPSCIMKPCVAGGKPATGVPLQGSMGGTSSPGDSRPGAAARAAKGCTGIAFELASDGGMAATGCASDSSLYGRMPRVAAAAAAERPQMSPPSPVRV